MATLSPFYNSRTVVYLPNNSPPVNCPFTPRAVRFSCIKIPLLWAVSPVSHFMGSCILLKDHRSLNPPTLIIPLPSRGSLLPLLSRRLAVSLASFSSLDYLSIMWGVYRNVCPRVWGVDRSLHSPLFSSSSFDLRSRCRLPNVPCVHTHGPISTISFVLMSRSTSLIIRSSPNLSLFLATSQSISPVD